MQIPISDFYALAPGELRALPSAARLVLRALARLAIGGVALTLPNGRIVQLGTADAGPQASLTLHNWNAPRAALRSGDIGFAESFIAGDWDTPDLPALLTVLLANRAALEALIYGNWLGGLIYRLRHALNFNSRRGSRRNIHAHYDIGNAFYRLWLDPSMTYSSALFAGDANRTLEAAQRAKYARILEQIGVREGASVLEIGCGWGGFAEAAMRAGASVTGLTLSTEQLAYARQRCDAVRAEIAAAQGPQVASDLRLQDYRDCHGRFDGIASIEMFEAVGEAYWPAYFQAVARNLAPEGRACVQTIVIADRLFERYRRGTDFIQQYIFPGGMLPSPTVFREQAARAGLRVVDEFAFGADYARTLAQWRVDFLAHRAELEAQGFDRRFMRTWEFYLAYCEAGFTDGSTDVVQYTLAHA